MLQLNGLLLPLFDCPTTTESLLFATASFHFAALLFPGQHAVCPEVQIYPSTNKGRYEIITVGKQVIVLVSVFFLIQAVSKGRNSCALLITDWYYVILRLLKIRHLIQTNALPAF